MTADRLHNERELLLRVAEGDERAFAEVFRFYYPLLSHVVAVYALSAMDKEDILHETFIRVWLSRDKLVEVQQFDAWVCRIASRECLRMISKNGRARYASLPVSETNDTEQRVHLAELNRLVTEAIEQMPAQRRRIYTMSRNEMLKPAEIAQRLSLSVNTVKNALVTALKDIRAYLQQAGLELPWILLPPLLNYFFSLDSTFDLLQGL